MVAMTVVGFAVVTIILALLCLLVNWIPGIDARFKQIFTIAMLIILVIIFVASLGGEGLDVQIPKVF